MSETDFGYSSYSLYAPWWSPSQHGHRLPRKLKKRIKTKTWIITWAVSQPPVVYARALERPEENAEWRLMVLKTIDERLGLLSLEMDARTLFGEAMLIRQLARRGLLTLRDAYPNKTGSK